MAGGGLSHEDVLAEERQVAGSGKDFVDKAGPTFSASAEEVSSCCDLSDYLSVGRA